MNDNVSENSDINYAEIQMNQPIMNIGTLGHVSHGKSTIVKQTSGKTPQQFSAEQVRNITIQLGYANAKIFKCILCDFYKIVPGDTKEIMCEKCGKPAELHLHFSWIDSPGHHSYMSTMLNGTAAMDAMILVIGSDENIPQPQTAEHLIAAGLMGLKHGVIVMNKLDLMTPETTMKAYTKTKEFLKGTSFENSQIVPTCANYGMNLDVLAKEIARMPRPERNIVSQPRMVVIRSFDVSKAGMSATHVKGGVAGGSLTRGILRVGATVEIRPGLIFQQPNPESGELEFYYKPVRTTVTSLFTEKTSLQLAIPGGLIGVGTKLDPTLTKQNRLVGQVIGLDLPEVYDSLKVQYQMIHAFNIKHPYKLGDTVLINVHSCEIQATVCKVLPSKHFVYLDLTKPVCVEFEERISISKPVDNSWRLCGLGTIKNGRPVKQIN